MKGGRDARTGNREGSHASPCVAGEAEHQHAGSGRRERLIERDASTSVAAGRRTCRVVEVAWARVSGLGQDVTMTVTARLDLAIFDAADINKVGSFYAEL